jgi:hypothetical protein
MMPPGKAAQQRRVPGCVCRRTRTAAGTVVSPRELMVDSNMLAAVDQSPIEPCTEARAYCGEMPSRHAPPEAHLPTNFALHYSTSRKIPDGHYFSPTNYILSGHSHLIETNKVRRNQANQINNEMVNMRSENSNINKIMDSKREVLGSYLQKINEIHKIDD